jgi:2-methylcitrate dehydratase PrpD
VNICKQLARNILGTRFETFNQETVDSAKKRIIDVIGCLIAGASLPPSPMLVDMVKDWGGNEESTILAYGGKAPAHNVGMVNTMMARLLDFEPVGPIVNGKQNLVHLSSTTVPTAFAIAEQNGVGGKELITALILGDDLASRIISASDYSFDSGWEANGTVPAFGAAAIAGRLGRFDENKMLNAFGIVLNQMAGTVQNVWDGTHAFVLPQGLATRAGIFSAELARRGFTGIKDSLLSKYGYFNLYCRTYHTEILTEELGKKFYSDGIFKIYPSCGGNHAAIEYALEIVNKHDIETEDIDEVTLGVFPATQDTFLAQPFEIQAYPPATARFNLRYNVANVLLRKSVRIEHFTEELIRDSKVVALAKKVKLTNLSPSEQPTTFLNIKMKDGREFSVVRDPSGVRPHRPVSEEEIRDKFKANVAFSNMVKSKNAEEALNMLEHLEEVDDIRQIINLLVA